METLKATEEIFIKVFKRNKFPVSLKAKAVFLYFRGLSLRAVKEYLLSKGYKVSIETIRKWFHAVGRALQAIYTLRLFQKIPHRDVPPASKGTNLFLTQSHVP